MNAQDIIDEVTEEDDLKYPDDDDEIEGGTE